MPLDLILAHVHAYATLCMTGLIWFVQVNHYPLFKNVAEANEDVWRKYEEAHQARTTVIVMPLMFAELGTAGWFAFTQTGPLTIAGAALIAIVWLQTFAVAVPIHAALGRAFDARLHARLVWTNWIRTVGWSARGVIGLMLLQRVLLQQAAAA
ncbi:MAG: hypothetical protein AAGI17_04935 [Planctomycetota bacterium]